MARCRRQPPFPALTLSANPNDSQTSRIRGSPVEGSRVEGSRMLMWSHARRARDPRFEPENRACGTLTDE